MPSRESVLVEELVSAASLPAPACWVSPFPRNAFFLVLFSVIHLSHLIVFSNTLCHWALCDHLWKTENLTCLSIIHVQWIIRNWFKNTSLSFPEGLWIQSLIRSAWSLPPSSDIHSIILGPHLLPLIRRTLSPLCCSAVLLSSRSRLDEELKMSWTYTTLLALLTVLLALSCELLQENVALGFLFGAHRYLKSGASVYSVIEML